jgi:hypothetical protein
MKGNVIAIKNNIHVEKYDINILHFIKTNKILIKDTYLAYSENGENVINVTDII